MENRWPLYLTIAVTGHVLVRLQWHPGASGNNFSDNRRYQDRNQCFVNKKCMLILFTHYAFCIFLLHCPKRFQLSLTQNERGSLISKTAISALYIAYDTDTWHMQRVACSCCTVRHAFKSSALLSYLKNRLYVYYPSSLGFTPFVWVIRSKQHHSRSSERCHYRPRLQLQGTSSRLTCHRTLSDKIIQNFWLRTPNP